MKLFTLPDIFPSDWSREQRLEVVRDVGRKAKEEFDKRYPAIVRWFREYDALYLLSFCELYFLSYPEGTDPEAYEGVLDFYHHYLEIMQAFSLMQDRTPSVRPLAENAEALKTEMKDLGELMGRREYDVPDDVTEEELQEHVLLCRMRNQTAAIRNWAYPEQMFAMTKGLAGGVRNRFRLLYGVDPEKVVDLLIRVVREIDSKLNAHHDKVRSFMRMHSYQKIVRAYNAAWPDMPAITDEQARELYAMSGESAKNLKAFLCVHSDLRISDIFTLRLDDVVDDREDVEGRGALHKIMDSWSLQFGALRERRPEFFILDNPVLKRPFIKIGDDTYFSAVVGILPHMALGLLEGLIAADDGLREEYNQHKGSYLQEIAGDLFERSFPNGTVFRQSQWKDLRTNAQGENDLTVIIDSFAIVAECKAGTVPPPAKRGAPLRFKRAIEDLVLEPAEQAHRFIKYLAANKGMCICPTVGGRENRIDTSDVKWFIPLTLTLEDLGFITCNVKDAIRAGLVVKDVSSLVPSMSIGALECVFEVLGSEVEKIHYLSRRREFEHHVDYLADELDLLGFYLDNGFNVGSAEYTGLDISLVGKSKELDPYFTAKAVGRNVKKPSLQMTQWWKDMIERICQRRKKRWTELGYILLNTTKEDQEKFEHELFCLKSKLETRRIEHKHNWVEFLSGPEQRCYLIAGFPYRPMSKTMRDSVIQEILATEKARETRGIMCIGVNVEADEYPYSVVAAASETHLQDRTEGKG